LPVRAIILPIFLLMFVSAPSLVRAQNPNGALRGEVQERAPRECRNAQVHRRVNTSSMNSPGQRRMTGRIPHRRPAAGSYRVTVTAKGF